MKGPEERLPDGLSFKDENGTTRYNVRIRWWDANATTFRKAAQGWDGGSSKKSRTTHCRVILDILKACQFCLGIIGRRASRRSLHRMPPA